MVVGWMSVKFLYGNLGINLQLHGSTSRECLLYMYFVMVFFLVVVSSFVFIPRDTGINVVL